MNKHSLTVWLSYVSYPVTTAVYLERALRRLCDVVTVGPRLPEEYIRGWALENMKQPIVAHDVDTPFDLDMQTVLDGQAAGVAPDLFLWVESAGGFLPGNMEALPCPRACYLIDSHLTLQWHLELARRFDFVFVAQRNCLDRIREVNPRSYWLPLGCDPEIHIKAECDKQFDVGFVGGVSSGSRREELLQQLNLHVPVHFERCFWTDMARVFSQSRIVFNEAINNDLNMRFFEALSTGSLLLSDMARDSGQQELFVAGEDYALYHDSNLAEVAKFYLDNERIRERVAARGRQLAHNAHTYEHRMDDLLNVVLSAKPDTWSAAELRQRSLEGLADPDQGWRDRATWPGVPSRSFVIPVLDYSPASEYNILTLLKDLEHVPGEVIVVFNSESVARELRDHPRIGHHVVMSRNIGVSRAWNVGLDIAESPTVFILNADLHVSAETIDLMEQSLWELDRAACVGPQGSFVNFQLACDHCYFDKGSFDRPQAVDAVSGFLFCVRRELFDDATLKFEGAYTPCYFEEWDLGLQIKKAGYKSYVVPTSAYEHHWSGTIRALRTIPYLGREETAGEILHRNRELFQTKWRGIVRRENLPDLLQSGWREYALTVMQELISAADYARSAEIGDRLQAYYPDDDQVAALCRFVGMQIIKQQVKE